MTSPQFILTMGYFPDRFAEHALPPDTFFIHVTDPDELQPSAAALIEACIEKYGLGGWNDLDMRDTFWSCVPPPPSNKLGLQRGHS